MRLPLLLFAFFLASPAPAAPLIVLDSGHEPSRPGAIGVCGKEEVIYNDELTHEVAAQLHEGGALRVVLTRAKGAEVSVSGDGADHLEEPHRAGWRDNPRLYERASIANRFSAAALISFHHDSTAEEFQETAPRACAGKDGKRLKATFAAQGFRAGFSLFVYEGADNARFEASLKIARALGAAFRAMGREPSNYHVESKDCASCRLLDAENGVYHKNLAILRVSQVPAVLVEAGVIVDEADEKIVSTRRFRRAAAKVIARSLEAKLAR